MLNVTNLPTKASGERITGKAANHGYRIEDGAGYEVCFIHGYANKDFVARDIAAALEMARDRGFEQGLASIRAALGVK